MNSTVTQQNILKALFQATAFPLPTSPLQVALVAAQYGFWAGSTAYATTGEFVSPSLANVNGHFYKLTTAGTSGTTEPVWPTAPGATVTDGTCVWTEASANLAAGTLPEVSGGGYARASVTPSSTAFPISAYTGSTALGELAENAAAVSYGSGNTTAAWGLLVGVMIFDSSTTPVYLNGSTLKTPTQVNSGDPFPTIPVDNMQFIQY